MIFMKVWFNYFCIPIFPVELIFTCYCTNRVYLGQGRLDGAFCDYTEKEKLEFLHKVHNNNVLNMEMESLAFAALTHHAGIRAAVICVTLLNRLNGDQVY